MGYFDHVKTRHTPTPTHTPAPVIEFGGNIHNYAAAALEAEADRVANATTGTRNHTLNAAAYNMGRHIGAGTIDLPTVQAVLAQAGRTCGLTDHEIDTILRTDGTGGLTAGATNPRHPNPNHQPPQVTVLDLTPEQDNDFWHARPLLTHLHDYARARRVSPWAVLGVTLARVIVATPHAIALPPTIGGQASLNMFIGLVGPSGSGKGAAEAVAAEALNVGYITTHNVGSGEGIAHGFMHRVKGNLEWNDDTHAVLFSVPEIDSLAAQGDRKGATLMPQLRSGWTGEQLGFGYADPTKRILVPAHQYRLCLVAGIQPGRAGCLLDDSDGGTPQRFLWMPAIDPEAPDVPPDCPPPLTWEAPTPGTHGIVGVNGTHLTICDTARDTIVNSRLTRLRGEATEALDGHAQLAQLKTAAALAIADGRYHVNDHDWELSAIILQKSDATRASVAATLRAKAHEASYARGEAEAMRAVQIAEKVEDAAIRRTCKAITRRLRAAPDHSSTWSEIRRTLPSRDRGHYEQALEKLLETGLIGTLPDPQTGAVEPGKGATFKLLDGTE